jgi:uncharacterized protein YndB with AHSA1/START domain
MKKYLIAASALVATVSLTVAALPEKKRVERSALISASPEQVFALVSSTEGFQKFSPYKDDEPNLQITPSGPARGVGATFAFKGKDAEGTQTIVAIEENKQVTMRIDLGAMGKPKQSFTLTPEDGKTRVVWATESEFGANPMGRIFGLFMDGYLGPVYERGLKNLDRVAQEGALRAALSHKP